MIQATPAAVYSPLGADPEFYDLVELFVKEVGERVSALEAASGAKEWPTVGRIAHQIKGAAGSYGFGEVTPHAAKLEAVANVGTSERDIVAALTSLRDICARLRSGAASSE